MKKSLKFILSMGVGLMCMPIATQATTTWTGAVDTDWNTAGNWSAGVPGVTDPVATFNTGGGAGTIDVTATPTVNSGIDFRVNTGGGNSNLLNWNPGAASTMDFNNLYVGGGSLGASTVWNHNSGQINIPNAVGDYQFRIGNDNASTYNMSGTAAITYNEAFSLGHLDNGNGHLVMNDSSTVADTVSGNGALQIGYSQAGAQGEITMNDTSSLYHQGTVQVGSVAGTTGTVNIHDSAVFDTRNDIRVGSAGAGHLVMDGDSVLRIGSGSNGTRFYLGYGATGAGTATLSGNAAVVKVGADNAHIGRDGDATLIMNDNSSFDVASFETSHRVSGSTSEITLNQNASIAASSFVSIGRSGTSELTLNDSSSVSATGTNPIRMGAQNGSAGTINVNGTSALSANGNIELGAVNSATSTTTINQNAGEVYVGASLLIGNGVVGNAATYNLDGGRLRANSITVNGATGVFNWGAGTLTVREVQQNASGDGSVINYAGSLTSSSGSVLELNDLYESGGIKFDKLAVSGALDLTAGGDVFEFWGTVQRLRGTGGVITGELQLISAGSVSGNFDNISGPGPDAGTFFRTWQFGEIAQGTSADDLQLNHGYLDYRADGLYFVYKVNGQVPEPETGMLIVFALLFLRGLSKRSWIVILRQALKR